MTAYDEDTPICGLRQAQGPLDVVDRLGYEDGGLAAELGLSVVRGRDASFEGRLEGTGIFQGQFRYGSAHSLEGPTNGWARLPPQDQSRNGGLDPRARTPPAERPATAGP